MGFIPEIVQYIKTNKWNSPYKQDERRKAHEIISLDPEKILDNNPTLLYNETPGETRDTRDMCHYNKGSL